MVKFVGKSKGVTTVGLVLTAGNLRRLQNDEAVLVNLRELGLDTDIVISIFYAPTEAHAMRAFAALVTEETVVTDERVPTDRTIN